MAIAPPAIEFNEVSDPTQYYWTMWKLHLFNAKSVQEVLGEVNECRSAYRDCYVRVVAFDNIKQCQVSSFIIHKPGSGSGNSYRY
jgi:ribulose-bisphosphate carboxylase small chain